MRDSNDILNVIKKAAIEAVEASKPTTIAYGEVTSISPLKIMVDQKMTLTKEQLVLSRNVTDHDTEISFNDSSIKNLIKIDSSSDKGNLYLYPDTPAETSDPARFDGTITGSLSYQEKIRHKITIYNALIIGDKVLLARVQGGQKYIVLDRVIE